MSDVEVTIPSDLTKAQERYLESATFHTIVHTLISMHDESGKRRMAEYAITGFLAENAGETIEVPREWVGLYE